MTQQAKRGPGRPRRGKGSEHVDLTLSREVNAALDQVTNNKSSFVDAWLREHPSIALILKEGENAVSRIPSET